MQAARGRTGMQRRPPSLQLYIALLIQMSLARIGFAVLKVSRQLNVQAQLHPKVKPAVVPAGSGQKKVHGLTSVTRNICCSYQLHIN